MPSFRSLIARTLSFLLIVAGALAALTKIVAVLIEVLQWLLSITPA